MKYRRQKLSLIFSSRTDSLPQVVLFAIFHSETLSEFSNNSICTKEEREMGGVGMFRTGNAHASSHLECGTGRGMACKKLEMASTNFLKANSKNVRAFYASVSHTENYSPKTGNTLSLVMGSFFDFDR